MSNRYHSGDLSKYKVLSREETNELLNKANTGDIRARNKIVTHNLKFIIKLAHSYKKSSAIDISDLVNVGVEGLIYAIDSKKFDPSRGFRFISWAGHWISQRMMKFIEMNHQIFNMHKGAIVRNLLGRISDIKFIENIVDPSIREEKRQEFKAAMLKRWKQATPKAIDENYEYFRVRFLSIDTPKHVYENNEAAYWLQLEAEYSVPANQETDVIEKDFQSKLSELTEHLLSILNDREKLILNRYICEQDKEDKTTLADIAKDLGVTRERVRQIKNNALLKIRNKYGISQIT